MRSLVFALCLLSSLSFASAGVIEGHCVDQDGERYPGIEVTLERLEWESVSSHATPEVIATTVADASAEFRFEDVEEGAYRLISRANDQHPTGWHALAHPDQGPYEVGVTNEYRLARGRVEDHLGNPVEGATIWRQLVQPFPRMGRVITIMASAETDARGEFTIEPVIELGRCPVRIELPNGETFGQELRGQSRANPTDEITVVTAPEPIEGFPARVQVVDSLGRGVEGASVRLRMAQLGTRTRVPQSVITNPDGFAEFASVPAGRWRIMVRDLAYRDEAHDMVSPQEGPHPVIQLYGDGAITGRVTNSRGEPMSSVALWAHRYYPDPATGMEANESHGWVRTEEDGTFVFDRLVWDQYRIYPSEGDDLIRRSGGPLGQTFTLSADNPTIDLKQPFVVDPLGDNYIVGVVRDTDGHPVQGVRIAPLIKERWQRIVGGHLEEDSIIAQLDIEEAAFTGPDGRFSVLITGRPSQFVGVYAEHADGRVGLISQQSRDVVREYPTREFLITIAEPVTVEGVLMRGDSPYPYTDVVANVVDVDGRYGSTFTPHAFFAGDADFYSAVPESDGSFTIGPLPRGLRWQLRPLNNDEADDAQPQVEFPLWGEIDIEPVTVRVWDQGHARVNVQVLERTTRRPIPNVLISGDVYANFDQRTGPNGELIRMSVITLDRDGDQRRVTIAATEDGYRATAIEGISSEPWQERPSPSRGRPPRQGWIIHPTAGEEHEITILMDVTD